MSREQEIAKILNMVNMGWIAPDTAMAIIRKIP